MIKELGHLTEATISILAEDTIEFDTPFVGRSGHDLVYAYGFRNPWRFSFDRETGALWAGDVGQNAWEEVDRVVKGGNHGWDCYEGFASYEPSGCPASGFVAPRAVYGHDEGCSVTGGYVYRGPSMPELDGWYVYGDFCSGKIWAVNTVGSAPPGTARPKEKIAAVPAISARSKAARVRSNSRTRHASSSISGLWSTPNPEAFARAYASNSSGAMGRIRKLTLRLLCSRALGTIARGVGWGAG